MKHQQRPLQAAPGEWD